ncbi:MAG: transglycosylase domain-containing protein [Flavobacteriia bacterium]|nr:transglycosylase domain-containing protein [Flavobacteriia bacterium]
MKNKTLLLPVEKQKKYTRIIWVFSMIPLIFIISLLLFQSEKDLPPVSMLDNPPELLASIVYADDGSTELGRYWKVNRTSVPFHEISPFLTDALIATEDERFFDHSGVDFKALMRAVVNLGSAGGASTITQQLAKQLFTLQARDRESLAKAMGQSIERPGRMGVIFSRIGEKARENIIATRLEERYTKEEIITMYLNQFDFLYNAVGIVNACKVYFNKKPNEITKEEAAMLVGMCKNPSLYNPYTYKIKNYRLYVSREKNITPDLVSLEDIKQARSKDSLRAVMRRNQVLYQWLKNSEKNNEALRIKISQAEYNQLKEKPIEVNYQVVDHKRGKAPYFRESLRGEVSKLFSQRKPDGSLKYTREDGAPWDIYRDGLKIYTTVNAEMQDYAEEALEKHLSDIQSKFDRNNKNVRRFPFSNSISDEDVELLMTSAMHRSDRYKSLIAQGLTEKEVRKNFNEETNMRVFSWSEGKENNYEKDTTMTPFDSIRYYKAHLQAGLISIEPGTGRVKAWVGGANIDHFAYDHVRLGRRQVGSTIKPFVYSAGISMGVIKPGLVIPDIRYCVELFDPSGNPDGQWCPRNSDGSGSGGAISIKKGLAMSKNNVAVYIMRQMGHLGGPQTVAKIMREMDIELRNDDVVPAMCLGSMDLSLFELVGAQATFVSKGIYFRPITIDRIEDRNGNVIYSSKEYAKEVLNENVAYTVLKMMKGVIESGTGGRLRYNPGWGGITYPTAGKTGTTQNNSDGWFVGLTPDLATGVWVGAEDRAVRFRSTDEGQGARTAMPIYGYFMNKVYKDPKIALATSDFERPSNYDESVFILTGTEFTPEAEVPDSLNIEL